MNARNPSIRPATPEDAADLARLIDIAGEGIPSWLWAKSAEEGQTPLDVGITRARRTTGGFSYTNAIVADRDGDVVGMALSYAIETAPEDDPNDLPPAIAPFIELEAKSVGTWYVNALAVRTGARGEGIGTALLHRVEELATNANCPTLSLQVYGQNTGAVRLYQRHGFTFADKAAVREHPCQPYYTGDVLLLLKPLAG